MSSDFWFAERDRIVQEYVTGLLDAAHAIRALKRMGFESYEARELLTVAAEDAFQGGEK